MVSQQSFEARLGYFQNGLAVLGNYDSAYNPNNQLIQLSKLQDFVLTVQAKNQEIVDKEQTLAALRQERKEMVFASLTTNPDCLEKRLKAIQFYIAAEIGTNTSVYKSVHSIIKKFHPTYRKKAGETERGRGKSPSEKSHVAMVGYAKEIIKIIQNLGAQYSPQNSAIIIANLQNFVATIDEINTSISSHLASYSDAVKQREKLYEGSDGMRKRITNIKNYLASLPEGKDSSIYIEFNRAIQGKNK